MIGRDDLLFVDVREEVDLLDELGHVHGVTLAPSASVIADGLPTIAKTQPIVVVCNDGRTSQRCVVALVADHGFEEIYHLVGGMIRWTAEERPIARVPTWTRLER